MKKDLNIIDMQSNGMIATVVDKTDSCEEPNKNCITLLDLDNQKQLSICQEARIKGAQYKIHNSFSSISSTSNLPKNKLSVYDWLPLKVCNSGLSINDQLQFGVSSDKR